MALVETSLVALRESLEAFLIVGIFAGLVVKLGRPEARKYLLWGVAAAVGVSVLIGVIIHATVREAFESSGSAEAFEGIASLAAVAILTYMIVWMYRHTLGLVGEIRKKTTAALDAGRPALLFALAFVAVAREGLETVLFFAALAPTTTATEIVLGLLIGVGISTVLAFLVFRGTIRLNVQKFLAVTGLLLVFFAGGLLMTAVHEFAEIGWLPETAKAWNTEWLLDQQGIAGSLVKAIFGYRESPAMLEVAAYFAYVLALGAWYLRGVLKVGRTPRATSQPA